MKPEKKLELNQTERQSGLFSGSVALNFLGGRLHLSTIEYDFKLMKTGYN
jgi:hypothetical protein